MVMCCHALQIGWIFEFLMADPFGPGLCGCVALAFARGMDSGDRRRETMVDCTVARRDPNRSSVDDYAYGPGAPFPCV